MNRDKIEEIVNIIRPGNRLTPCGNQYLKLSCLILGNHRRGDRRPSATVSYGPCTKSYYKCFGCGVAGPFIKILQRFCRTSNPSIMSYIMTLDDVDDTCNFATLSDMTFGSLFQDEGNDEGPDASLNIKYEDRTVEITSMSYPVGNVKKFLLSKGIFDDSAFKLFRQEDEHTLLIPYMKDGRYIGAKCRDILATASDSKYSMIPELRFSTLETLFLDWKISYDKIIYLVEGELDAAHIMQFNIPAVAIGGTGWNRYKRDTMLELRPSGVLIAMDNDDSGQSKVKKIRESLQDYVDVKNVNFGCDPKNVDYRRLINEHQQFHSK